MKITFFDVEFSNIKNKSICQIGILCRDISNFDIEDEKVDILVNPEDIFDDNCIRIHGINKDSVQDEETFPKVWKKIEKYFTNAVVVGHNVANTDLVALQKTLERYNIQVPELYYICTYDLARKVIPSYMIREYSLRTLCEYFDIKLPNSRNAFSCACACSDLFDNLREKSNFDISKIINPFMPELIGNCINYNSNISLNKDINSLYGMIRGFGFDSIITESEKQYIIDWRENFSSYQYNEDIKEIITIIDEILNDGKITISEIKLLEMNIRKHLDIISTSIITLSTQILNGIIRGIIQDEIISDEEFQSLRTWLYENSYLAGHYPYDKLTTSIENILFDGKVEDEEIFDLLNEIESLLEPIEKLKREFNSLDGKKVYLSGNFEQKNAVKKYILEKGGLITSTITKDTNLVVVGDKLSETNINKINKYNNKGTKIHVASKDDVIVPEKTFAEKLINIMNERNLDNKDVWKKAGISRQLFSKIFCNEGYIPHKNTICTIALAIKLNIDETLDLLNSAGYTLSRSFIFDRVIEESLRHKIYDLNEINIRLSDEKSPILLANTER